MFNAISVTKENFKLFSFYNDFMSYATQHEFLKSQQQFYPAVSHFPCALFVLGALIPYPEVRLKVLENLNEEHGFGDRTKFHINTFTSYLESMDRDNIMDISIINPVVKNWIDSWFNYTPGIDNAVRCATVLAGIEYLYAPISEVITNHTESLTLKFPQVHYRKHAKLDWEHGGELMEIVKALQPYSSVSDQEIYKIFNKSQHDMLDVFRSMIVLTKHETDIMGKLPIAFYYLREDYSIPHSFLTNNHINCVSIASGGESILNLSTMEQKEIIAIDMNSNQLNLTKIKMEDKQNSNISDYAGKFEAMFSHIRRRLSSQDIQTIKMATNVSCKEVVDFICQDVFQKKHLITIFGEDAVRFTKKDFGEHFSKVFSSRKQPYSFGDRNIYNILTNSPLKEPPHGDGSNIIYKHVRILDDTFFNDLSFTNKQGIDYIDLSNIGDWMEYYVFKDIIMSAHQKMNKNGILVLRKLLGDYSLKETMETLGFSCHSFKDSTEFYAECIIGIKS